MPEITERLWDVVRRTDDAVAVATRAAERFADRVVHCPTIGEGNLRLLLRDPERPGWVVPVPIVELDLDHGPPRVFGGHDPAVDQVLAAQRALREREQAGRLPPRRAHPARFMLREGERVAELTYGPDGWLAETMRSDGSAGGPEAVSVLGDASWQTLDAFVDAVTRLDPRDDVAVRVWQPVVCPGGAAGVWFRVQRALEAAAFAGELGDEAGWWVVDGYTGAARAFGPTFDAAVARWRQALDRVAPLPPVPPPPAPLPPPSPPTSSTEKDDETGEIRVQASMTLVFRPRVELPWPEPDPHTTPAAAVPVPALPAVPAAWAAAGFRHVRLFGDHGQAAWALLRDDGHGGWTAVGSECVPALHPDTLDAALDALDADLAAGWDDRFGSLVLDPPWAHPEYRWFRHTARLEDGVLRTAGSGAGVEAGRPSGTGAASVVVRCRHTPEPPPPSGGLVVPFPRRA